MKATLFWFLIELGLLPLAPVFGMNANYSVLLMKGLAPAGWSGEAWAAAADSMIGKTQAHILTDMIEDLGIELRLTEGHIREQIDADRKALGLQPLPPHELKPGPFDFLKEYQPKKETKEDLTQYLPSGWTEEKYLSHTEKDLAGLSEDVLNKIRERDVQEQEAWDANPNKGYLEAIPADLLDDITEYVHEQIRKINLIPPGVRVYKRDLAPLVQVVSLQSVEEWGFLLYRTFYRNQTAWDTFMEGLAGINEIQLANTMQGTNLELVKDLFMMPVADSGEVGEAAGAQACVDHFKSLREQDALPIGLDVGMIYMADEEAILSLIEFDHGKPMPFVWALDVNYDSTKQEKYPDGYSGRFKVVPSAMLHGLYVPLASGLMTPVDIWKLLQPETRAAKISSKTRHDEL